MVLMERENDDAKNVFCFLLLLLPRRESHSCVEANGSTEITENDVTLIMRG